MIVIAAPAKINLYLHIVGKCDDGFHCLESLVAFVKVCDFVSVQNSSRLVLKNIGPFGDSVWVSNNLVMRAARYFQKISDINLGAEIILTKNLPISSGVGGGSSDATATIKALSRLWNIRLEDCDFSELVTYLGADAPICLLGRTAFVSGVGEKLNPINISPIVPIVLINPMVGLSTPTVFKSHKKPFTNKMIMVPPPYDFEPLIRFLSKNCKNDLTDSAISLVPEILTVLDILKKNSGCMLARMSGSGATCFGVFETILAANSAASKIQKNNPRWWVKSTELIGRTHLSSSYS